MSENSVVLPAPLSPSSVKRWPRSIVSDTSHSTSRPAKAWLTPVTASGGAVPCAATGVVSMAPLRRSWPHHHAPRLVADRYRFEHLESRHVDHRDVVADAVGRVEPALVAVEGKVPHALADLQVFLHFVGLRVDHSDLIGRAERDEGELAILGQRDT